MGSRIYVDIQSILDLRQSALVTLMGLENAIAYVSSEAYGFRELDEFPVDMRSYHALMNLASPDLFRDATVTYIEVVLKSKLNTLEKRNAFNQTSDLAEILVNIYPFRLTTEQADKLRDGIFIKLDRSCKVTVISEPLSTWSPAYMKASGLYAFFCYSFSDWLNANKDRLDTEDLKEIKLYFPAIGAAALDKDEIKKFSKLGFKDVFSYMEYILSRVASVSFLPSLFYTNIVTATAHLEKSKVDLDVPINQEEGEDSGNINKSG